MIGKAVFRAGSACAARTARPSAAAGTGFGLPSRVPRALAAASAALTRALIWSRSCSAKAANKCSRSLVACGLSTATNSTPLSMSRAIKATLRAGGGTGRARQQAAAGRSSGRFRSRSAQLTRRLYQRRSQPRLRAVHQDPGRFAPGGRWKLDSKQQKRSRLPTAFRAHVHRFSSTQTVLENHLRSCALR